MLATQSTNAHTSYSNMNTNALNWTLIRSFLAAVERGSLLGAARAIGASQPTLGRHIAELEAQLGLVLFERSGRGLVATPQALALVEAARQMEGGAARLIRLAQGSEVEQQGPVRITASQPVACWLLPPLLAQMRELLPRIEVSLVASNAVSNLLRREADIALRMLRPEQASLSMRRIGQISIVACAHADYLRRRGVPLRLQDLAGHDLVGGDNQDEIGKGMLALGLPADQLRYGLRSDDLIVQWAAVRAGLGVGFIADFVQRGDPQVSALLPMLPLPRFPIWLTVHREVHSSARIRAVYDFLAERVPLALAG